MGDAKVAICRLCLNLTNGDECQILDQISQDILKVIAPEVDFDICLDPKLCQSCYKTMLRCYRFKCNCLKNAENMKIESSRTETTSQTNALEKKCDFCANKVDEESLEEFETRKIYYMEVLKSCLPEWTVSNSANAVPCEQCLKTLTTLYTFIGLCSSTEDRLKNFLSARDNNEEKLNLFEVVQFSKTNEGHSSSEKNYVINPQATTNESIPNFDIKTEVIKTEEVHIKTEVLEEEELEEVGSIGQSCSDSTKTPTLLKRKIDNPGTSRATKKAKVEQRSIGIQVKPTDLIETCSVGVQVDLLPETEIVSPNEEEVSSSTQSAKRKHKFKPRILSRKKIEETVTNS